MRLNFEGYEITFDIAEDDGRPWFGVESIKTDGASSPSELAEWMMKNAFAIEQEARKQLEREVQQARFEAQEDAA